MFKWLATLQAVHITCNFPASTSDKFQDGMDVNLFIVKSGRIHSWFASGIKYRENPKNPGSCVAKVLAKGSFL